MIAIEQTDEYARWINRLRDTNAKVRVEQRLRRLRQGNPGDVRPVGRGVSELRIDYGQGYRVYFFYRSHTLVVLLGGGDKQTQERDIKKAVALAEAIRRGG